VINDLAPAKKSRLVELAQNLSEYLAALPSDQRAAAMTIFHASLMQETTKLDELAAHATTRVRPEGGLPTGAAEGMGSNHPPPEPIPTPPEVIAATLANFNETELLEELREARAGGKTLDEFLSGLMTLTDTAAASSRI
jgi:hypothetical protein